MKGMSGFEWFRFILVPCLYTVCFCVVKCMGLGSFALTQQLCYFPRLCSAYMYVSLEWWLWLKEQQVAWSAAAGAVGLCNATCCAGCFSLAFPCTCVWVFVWIGEREWSFLKHSCGFESFRPEKMKSVCPFILERLQKGFNVWEMLDKRCCWKAKVQSGIS